LQTAPHLEGLSLEVLAVQFQQVEGVQKDMTALPLLAQQLEDSQAVLVAGDSFAID
jgi:hypothetical protein